MTLDHALAILGGVIGGAVVAFVALFRPPRVH